MFYKKYKGNVKSSEIKKGVLTISGLGNFFQDLLNEHDLVYSYLLSITKNSIKEKVISDDFTHVIGVHIRLGDYRLESSLTPMNWYKEKIDQIRNKYSDRFKFYLFSDGTEEELKKIISIPNVYKVFYGNALADIWALSKCQLIIGSDSSFSAWGAFLGQVPIIFRKFQFGNILKNTENQLIVRDGENIPNNFLERLL